MLDIARDKPSFHMKCHVLFSLKKKEENNTILECHLLQFCRVLYAEELLRGSIW